jgi:hypothetical protein
VVVTECWLERNGAEGAGLSAAGAGKALVLIVGGVFALCMSSKQDPQYEARFGEDGFFEVRECESPDRWIACDFPVEIEQ